MQSIRVGAVQMNGRLNAVARNLDEVEAWSRKAADAGAELVLFPETLLQGQVAADPIWHLAEEVPGGPCVRRLEKVASAYGLILSVGMTEKDHDVCYNTQALVGPQGYIGKSRKVHLSGDERLGFRPGDDIPVFDIGPCRVGQCICYDVSHPEVCRTLALKGTEVILMPHAGRTGQWRNREEEEAVVQRAKDEFGRFYPLRARENACFLVVANQAGNAGRVKLYPPRHAYQPVHAGACLVIDPSGEIIAESRTKLAKAELLVCDLDAERMPAARGHKNYTMMTRRPELYGAIVAPQGSIPWGDASS